MSPAAVSTGSSTGVVPGRAGSTATAAVIAAAVVVGVSIASVLIGSRPIAPGVVLDAADPLHAIAEARIGRTALALAVGAALGLAGACMQGLTRNPLADPGILGVNAGASLAMVIAIGTLGVSDLRGYICFAFVGATLAAVTVHAAASLGRDGATPMKIAIAGAAVTAALSSWTSAVLLVDRRTMEVFRFWAVGTVGGRGLDALVVGLPFLFVGAALALAGARILNTLALGDDLARGLGRSVVRDRLLVGAAFVLLAGTATALAGPIAFVGLIVPHLVRSLVGSDHRRVLPFAMAYGAVLTVVADVVGRIVMPPVEVQVGIMTAVVGVPVFLALIRRGRMAGL